MTEVLSIWICVISRYVMTYLSSMLRKILKFSLIFGMVATGQIVLACLGSWDVHSKVLIFIKTDWNCISSAFEVAFQRKWLDFIKILSQLLQLLIMLLQDCNKMIPMRSISSHSKQHWNEKLIESSPQIGKTRGKFKTILTPPSRALLFRIGFYKWKEWKMKLKWSIKLGRRK